MKKLNTWVKLICQFFIILFAYVAFSKLRAIHAFRLAMVQSKVLAPYAPVLMWLVPLMELGIVVLLFFPRTRRTGLYGTAVLLIVFTGYIMYMMSTYVKLPCSCGGIINKMSWKQHLEFNIGSIVLAVTGITLTYVEDFRRVAHKRFWPKIRKEAENLEQSKQDPITDDLLGRSQTRNPRDN